jgi:hypothetical protein
MTILKQKDMDKVQKMMTMIDKAKYLKKFKYRMMLFSIFETTISINTVTLKEKILLNNAIVDFDNNVNSSLKNENKFKLRILVPMTSKSVTKGGKYIEHIFGVESEIIRKEWIFLL